METEIRLARVETFVQQLVSMCGGSFLEEFDLGKGIVQLLVKFEQRADQELTEAFDILEEEEGDNVKGLSFRKMVEKVQFLQTQITNDFYPKIILDSRDAGLTKQIEEVKKEYVHKDELNDTLLKLHESFMGICKDLKKFSKNIEVKLMEKITSNETQAEERSKGLADTSNRLYNVINSKLTQLDLDRGIQSIGREIRNVEDQIRALQHATSNQENALQRIDELLLEKASKVDLQKTNLQFTEYYRRTDIDKRLLTMSINYSEASEDLKMLQEKHEELRKQTDEIKQKQDTPRTEQLEYRVIKTQVQEIRTSLSHKADRAETIALIESKVGVDMIDLFMEELDLNKRQTHLTAVMLLTTLRGLYTVGRDSMTSELKRREHLIGQVENLVSWINRHKAERIITPSKKGSTLPSIDNTYSM